MDLSPNTEQFREGVRRDGWSPEHKARFLMLLADSGNVRLAARRCGLSAQSAYVQRRRDPAFARGWAAALAMALTHAEQVLADRALEGVEEPIYYRGELIGTRRRFDTRLLLAHLARLDRQAQARGAVDESDRFDELVALVAGAEVPEALAGEDLLPAPRETQAEEAGLAAEDAKDKALSRVRGNAANEARDEEIFAAGDAARAAVCARWDAWLALSHATVDRLDRTIAQDRVNPSTSPDAGRLPAQESHALGTARDTALPYREIG